MYQAVEILVPLASFAMIFGIVYVVITAMHRKEIAMIEAGMNPNDGKKARHSKIRTALLFLLVPIGIVIGNAISANFSSVSADSLGLLFAFIFGGLALTISYFVDLKMEKRMSK